MFEKTLTDVVKGIRGTKRDTGLYISQCIAEIKNELKSPDIFVKANALQKLTFLQMMGYGMSWASFACVEVMSSQRFAHKRIGYLAGCQGFTEADTDIILLTTNLLKKELKCASSIGLNGVYEAGLAINFVANVVTEDLARELLPEVTHLTQHPHPYLRKKAVLCLFKLFVKYPQGLRLAFDRIQQCLTDADAPVASCAVNVITELSDKNPKNYLLMAPQFFHLLTSSSNNWMLIKVVKLLGSLVSEEPRLARKLLDPLSAIVKNTAAKSLLYEAVYTITLALPYCRKADGTMPASVPDIVQMCSQTLKEFVEDSDQNLKYLGLVGFGSLMTSHPQVLSQTREHKDLILKCLSDEDITIRTRALELLSGMATRKNVRDLITQLLRHVECADGPYQRELVEKIITICRQDKYALLTDFSWYLTQVLVRLAHVTAVEEAHGELLKNQMIDVALRVLPVRKVAVKAMSSILLHQSLQTSIVGTSSWAAQKKEGVMRAVLPAAAWVVGEYSHLIAELLSESDDADELDGQLSFTHTTSQLPGAAGPYHAILKALVSPELSIELATSTQSLYVQSAMKVFASACASSTTDADLEACLLLLRRSLPFFVESTDSEVQERALSSLKLLVNLGITGITLLPSSVPLIQTNGITSNNADNHETSGEESDNENGVSNGAQTGDLLSLGTMTAISFDKQHKRKLSSKAKPSSDPFDMSIEQSNIPTTSPNKAGSTAVRCRAMADTLVALLVPDPMKPVGTKAQRRVPPPALPLSLAETMSLSVFDFCLTEDIAICLMVDSGNKKTVAKSTEEVSFTQQRRFKVEPPDSTAQRVQFGAPVVASRVFTTSTNPFEIFDNTGGPTEAHRQTSIEQHPFYLQSSSTTAASTSEPNPTSATQTLAGKFGVIQLGDDDGDEHDQNHHAGKHSKKDKKKNKKKSKESTSTFNDADLAMFTTGGLASTTGSSAAPSATAASSDSPFAVYHSDEEEVGFQEGNLLHLSPAKRPPRKSDPSGREFAGLAQVDLTKPLEPDEVMPVRTHRQVPDRSVMTGYVKQDQPKKEKKKKKKDKNTSNGLSGVAAGGDLLGLGMFDTIPSLTPSPQVSHRPSLTAATTDDFFLSLTSQQQQPRLAADANTSDLLNLTQLPTTSLPITFHSNQQEKASNNKRPWLKATIKAASSNGSEGNFGLVDLHYKVHIAKSKTGVPPSASLTLRFTNNGRLSMRSVSITAENHEVKLDDIPPGQSVECEKKLGPFSYEDASGESSHDFKGIATAAGCSKVVIKFSLPTTMLLKPVKTITADQVMDELATGEWSSGSVKLDLASVDRSETIGVLTSFLKATPVGNNMDAATLASYSATGTQVRALVKVKSSSVKVDVKCSNGNVKLGKAIISDLKRLLL